MSSAVFSLATYPGVSWDIMRDPVWSTVVKTSVSGREYRSANFSYPMWQYKCAFEVLRARAALQEMQSLAGFYNARQGAFDTFLFNDPDDNTVTLQALGTGNAVTTQFQLVRSFGGNVEPVWDTNSSPLIYVNGILKTFGTDYTIGLTGLITFTVAPGAGLAVAWTGTYYWRCRFLKDNLSFQQFMRQLWTLRSLEFITVKP